MFWDPKAGVDKIVAYWVLTTYMIINLFQHFGRMSCLFCQCV